MNDYTITVFRDGIFALNTRRFGTVAEIMIKKMYGFDKSNTISYDLYDHNKSSRIEVKFSRATKENETRIVEENVIEQCLYASKLENRALNASKTDYYRFDSNIQQVKCRNFDFLFYGLFFMDQIEIYGIHANNIYNIPGYSDFQHFGNKGEGQFHLNNNSIDFHRQNFYQRTLTYYELFELLVS